MEGIMKEFLIFKWYQPNNNIPLIMKTIPLEEFSTENFEEEVMKVVIKHRPETKTTCDVVKGWSFKTK